jgi:hypothetical protein
MYASLVTSSWVSLREGCELRHCVNDSESVDFIISGGSQLFEFECDHQVLRAFIALGQQALAEMGALRANEQLDGACAE